MRKIDKKAKKLKEFKPFLAKIKNNIVIISRTKKGNMKHEKAK